MKLIVGLGNPGVRYANTRHNLGWAVVKALSKQLKGDFKSDKYTASRSAKVNSAGDGLVLALPQVYMNLSGSSVSLLIEKYLVYLKELLVVVDDINLPLGCIRIRKGGSAGGHNGLKSVIDALGSQDFPRLRLGIAPTHKVRQDLRHFVLRRFARSEAREVSRELKTAVDCCLRWVQQGIEEAMNIYNIREGQETYE